MQQIAGLNLQARRFQPAAQSRRCERRRGTPRRCRQRNENPALSAAGMSRTEPLVTDAHAVQRPQDVHVHRADQRTQARAAWPRPAPRPRAAPAAKGCSPTNRCGRDRGRPPFGGAEPRILIGGGVADHRRQARETGSERCGQQSLRCAGARERSRWHWPACRRPAGAGLPIVLGSDGEFIVAAKEPISLRFHLLAGLDLRAAANHHQIALLQTRRALRIWSASPGPASRAAPRFPARLLTT